MRESLPVDFAARLTAARAHHKLSLRTLAEAAGISHQTVKLLEHGENSPSLDTCERLATALDVPPSWLAFGAGRAPSWASDPNAG